MAVERLRQHQAKSKVVILLTDGVSNAGEIQPLQAANLAAANDIKVYTIGAGITGYAPFPVNLADGRVALKSARVEIDEDTLKDIAIRTGGIDNARDADGVKRVYKEIDALERSEVTEIRYLQYREHFSTFVLLALILISVISISWRYNATEVAMNNLYFAEPQWFHLFLGIVAFVGIMAGDAAAGTSPNLYTHFYNLG